MRWVKAHVRPDIDGPDWISACAGMGAEGGLSYGTILAEARIQMRWVKAHVRSDIDRPDWIPAGAGMGAEGSHSYGTILAEARIQMRWVKAHVRRILTDPTGFRPAPECDYRTILTVIGCWLTADS